MFLRKKKMVLSRIELTRFRYGGLFLLSLFLLGFTFVTFQAYVAQTLWRWSRQPSVAMFLNPHDAGLAMEIGKYYSLADVFVLLSDSETWGVVVNEVMNFGKPVIVSDTVGCGPDLVKQGENGYIFPVGDVEELSKHLDDLSKNPSRRKAFGKKSLEIVKNYSFDKDVEAINGVINNIK